MILSGDLKIYRARNTKHFSYLTSPRRSDTTRHAQLRVGRSLVTLLIGVSFSFNAFCFLSCIVIQIENMGHVIKSFTAKIFFCEWQWNIVGGGNLLVRLGSSFYSNYLTCTSRSLAGYQWKSQAEWFAINKLVTTVYRELDLPLNVWCRLNLTRIQPNLLS